LRNHIARSNTGRTAFVAFFTAGFPTMEHTVPVLLQMEVSVPMCEQDIMREIGREREM
jgi:tryptophan synthase alpha subunit